MPSIVASAQQKIISVTEKIIAIGLPVLYFFIAIAFYLRTYDSAQIKITLVQVGGVIILATWLIKMIEDDTIVFLKRNLVVIFPLVAFLVSGIISHLHSSFPLASANELIRRIVYVGFALIIISEFNSEKKMGFLFNCLVAAAFVATIYGIIQHLDHRYFPLPPEPGLDPFIWRGAFAERIFSTFGNPNFFGDFLVVMGPIVLAMYLRTHRIHLLLLWFMITFCVYQTISKGAWLGFAAGLVVFVFLFVGFFSHAQKAKLRRILFSMLAATILLVGIGMYHQMKKRPDSSSFRIFTWLSTWEMINTNPWLGTGIGTFYVTYPAWRRPQIFFIEGRHNTETDHPEDEYLEVWFDEGLIGFGIFLLLLASYLTLAFRNLSAFSKLNAERPQGDIRAYYQLGVITSLAAQLVHNYVCVSLRFVSSGVMLWLLFGLIGSLNVNNPLLSAERNRNFLPKTLPVPLKRFLQAMIVVVAAYFVNVYYGYFKADIHHNMAIFFSKQGQWDPALENYNKIMKENPSFIMAHYFMGNVFNDRWVTGDPERSINKYKDVWKLAPNYVQSHHQAGLIYLKWGEDEKRRAEEARQKGSAKSAQEHEQKKTELWNKALAEFELYRKIDPIFPLNYYRMAWIYTQMGKTDKAEEIYLEHLKFPEKLKQPPYNIWVENWEVRRPDEYAETSINLGNLRFMQNDFAGAEKYYQQALGYKPDQVNALKNLAILYGRQGKLQPATEIWQKLRSLAPQDPDVQRVFQAAARQ